MIPVYQMPHLLSSPQRFTYQSTKGHNFKLNKQHFQKKVRSHAISVKEINDWNSLPKYIVNDMQLLDEN